MQKCEIDMTKTAEVSHLTRRLSSTADLSRVSATVCVHSGVREKRFDDTMEINEQDELHPVDTDTEADFDPDGDIDGVTRPYQLRDDRRVIIFTGVKLAGVSSERRGVQRWTDIDIYRTDAGRYIVNRVGVSVVAHSVDCSQVASKKRYGIDKIMPDECAPRDREPCPICRPDVEAALDADPASLTFEQDKHRTSIWDQATAMIDSLYTQNTHNQRALSSLMLWALSEAAKRDPVVMEAYNRVVQID